MQKYTSHSEDETKKFAQDLAKSSQARIFALTGDLGAGKTTFVQGFAQGLKIKDKIISPTFVLIRQHKLSQTEKTLFHIDLYRLEDNPSIKGIGLKEILSNSNNLVLIEWAEKIEKYLPKNTVWIKIEERKDNTRIITIP